MYLSNYDVSDSPEWNHCLNLLLDDDYSEIEANGPDDFYTKKKGKRVKIDEIKLGTGEKYIEGIKRGLIPHVKSAWPFKDNSYLFEGPLRYTAGDKLIRGRCHIVLPPAADFAQITIAKKSTALPSLESIAERGSLSTEMLTFLLAAIAGNLTMAISGGTGAGKALALDTPIPTPLGWATMGDLRVGDQIFDHHGTVGTVTHKFPQPARQVYRVTFSTGETIDCDAEHNWWVSTPTSRKVNSRPMGADGGAKRQPLCTVKTTAELIKLGLRTPDGKNNVFQVPMLEKAVEFANSLSMEELPIHPYLLGLWLGDGFSTRARISAHHTDQVEYRRIFDNLGINHNMRPVVTKDSAPNPDRFDIGMDDFMNKIRSLGMGGFAHEGLGKTVPAIYEFATPEARTFLLQGLMDSDGYTNESKWHFGNTNEDILAATLRVATSLGLKAKLYNDVRGGSVVITTALLLGLLPRKRDKHQAFVNKHSSRKRRVSDKFITSIEAIEGRVDEMACITVDTPDSTYLAGYSYTTTHNTTMLEALAKHFRHDQRIGVAEDAPELYLSQPNVTYLHSVPYQPGMNPNDVAKLSWVVQQFQRMRTDKLIIGETRGEEFADFLVAANSGMDGSMTTLHANNAVQCLDKMTNFAIKASNAPVRTINTDIANSVDLIVQLIILPNGGHRTSQICEVTNTLATDDTARITTNVLYSYDKKTDSFIKESQMTDGLRKRMESSGIDIRPFLISSVGARSSAHSNSDVAQEILDKAAPGHTLGLPTLPTGIPTGPGRRTL